MTAHNPVSGKGHRVLLWWVLAALLSAPSLWAGPAPERADEVKAAFILNFARFVEWPTERHGADPERLRLCLYRSNPLEAAIGTIRGKRVAGRELIIQTVENVSDEQGCDILFVPPAELERFNRDSTGSSGRSLLTITDLTSRQGIHFLHSNILISLVRDGTRMGFEINLSAVQRSGLQVSSELLKLGRIVDGH